MVNKNTSADLKQANEELINIALGKKASQSSYSKWSKPDDPNRAVNGVKNGKFSFCTEREHLPWWMVDLGDSYPINSIKIFNREDCAYERAKGLTVQLSSDSENWTTIAEINYSFGGYISGSPLALEFPKKHQPTARFVKLQLLGENHLHLDEVEIFTLNEASCTPKKSSQDFKIHTERKKESIKIHKVNSFLIYLNNEKDTDRSIAKNSFELCTEKWLKDFIKPDSNVIDVGANIGYFSLLCAKGIVNGTVFAIEPTSYGYSELKKNVAINNFNNIKPQKIALGSINKKSVNISYQTNKWNTGDVSDTGSSWLKQDGKITSVQTEAEDYCDFLTLDSFVQQEEINRIDILKINLDGLELNVLQGGINSILNFKPVIILELEYSRNQEPTGNLKEELIEIISQLFEAGYSAISEAGVSLQDIKSLISNLLYYKNRNKTPGNYLFVLEKHKPIRFGKHYEGRIKDVLSCPYNKAIPRVKDAGKIEGNIQVMHNGLKVYTDSYYPNLITPMLEQNRGVHEPEEEVHFLKILNLIHSKQPTIVELGCYWAFYSMWFLTELPNSRAYLVEPDSGKLKCGQKNFEMNNFTGDWTQAYVGAKHLNLDTFLLDKGIDYVNILHSDIQSAEVEMLLGAKNYFTERKISYAFISTHSQKLHLECLDCLNRYNYYIVYSADFYQTRCHDGIIVASSEPLSFKI